MSTIAKHFLLAFEGNLKRQTVNGHGATQNTLEDICPEEPIFYKDLPKVVPQVVRQQLVAKSREIGKLQNEIEDMLAELEQFSGRLLAKREEAEEAKRPKCKCCGQRL